MSKKAWRVAEEGVKCMATVLGIDVGTSSLKCMLLDTARGVVGVAAQHYPVETKQMLWAEHDPLTWWRAAVAALSQLRARHARAFEDIGAVGLCGQMHGPVLVDADGRPVRPAMLWLDRRAGAQLEYIERHVSREKMRDVLCNRVACGMAFSSLLWIRAHEPDVWARASHMLLPKDYLRLKLTDGVGGDFSDASATMLFDPREREWAWPLIDQFALPRGLFPPCHGAMDIAGAVSAACARETSLAEGIPVVYGSGDHMAQCVGNGAITPNSLVVNIGTGGQVSVCSEEARVDPQLRLQMFCHALPQRYTIYGATLSSGLALKWLKENVLGSASFADMDALAAQVPAGSEELLHLPYLCGERTPYMNPDATGLFLGLRLTHDRRHFIRSVMEGVSFSLKDSLCILQQMGIPLSSVIASGGGAASPLWMQMLADIFELPVRVSATGEQACLGACLLAAVGVGLFRDVQEACSAHVRMQEKTYEPRSALEDIYRQAYARFGQAYAQNQAIM